MLDLPFAQGLPYPPEQNVGTSLHGQRPCLIQCMARLSGFITVLGRTEDFTLSWTSNVLRIQFSQAWWQVLIHTTGAREWECPVCQEDERSCGEVKAVTQWGKGPKWCLGGQRHQSGFTTAAGRGTPFTTIPNVLWLHSKGKMPLWFHFIWGGKAWVFPFLSASVCHNFAVLPPLGMDDYLIHICLCDDLVQIKGGLMPGSKLFQAGNS